MSQDFAPAASCRRIVGLDAAFELRTVITVCTVPTHAASSAARPRDVGGTPNRPRCLLKQGPDFLRHFGQKRLAGLYNSIYQATLFLLEGKYFSSMVPRDELHHIYGLLLADRYERSVAWSSTAGFHQGRSV